MAQTINWVAPTNTSVGSVLIYRATDTKADSLGSRTIIATTAAKNGVGSWVTEYSDASGTADYIYRVQFWDGVGSSPLSDAMGREYSEQLATFSDVLRLARLTNYQDIGSDIVYDAINDATEEVFSHYGDPVKRTAFYLDSQTGVKGQAYDFTGDYVPVYQVREVFVDTVDTQIVPNTSYDVNFGNGVIKFTDDFIGSYQGRYVMVHWVPAIANILVKNMAAINLIEGEMVFSGAGTKNPYVDKLQKKVEEAKEIMRPRGIYSTKSFDTVGDYDYVPQKLDRTILYFNN